jgi:hypothetical protein
LQLQKERLEVVSRKREEVEDGQVFAGQARPAQVPPPAGKAEPAVEALLFSASYHSEDNSAPLARQTALAALQPSLESRQEQRLLALVGPGRLVMSIHFLLSLPSLVVVGSSVRQI